MFLSSKQVLALRNEFEEHKEECRNNHRSSDEKHRRVEDQMKILVDRIDKICANTESIAKGEALKEFAKGKLFAFSAVCTATTIALASIWHGIGYLAKFAAAAGGF